MEDELTAGADDHRRRGAGWSRSGLSKACGAVVADIACFTAFAAIGRHAHDESGGVAHVAVIAWPFVAAWLAAATGLGVYRHSGPRQAAAAWLVAWPCAIALRVLQGRGVPISFDIVALLFNMALLCGWRAIAARLERHDRHA